MRSPRDWRVPCSLIPACPEYLLCSGLREVFPCPAAAHSCFPSGCGCSQMGRPVKRRSSLAVSKGTVPLSARVRTPAVGSVGASPVEAPSSFRFVQSWASPRWLSSQFVWEPSDVPLGFRGAGGRGKGEGALLFLLGWTDFPLFRVSEFGTVNMAQTGSCLRLNKTIGIKPFVSCITLQETPN